MSCRFYETIRFSILPFLAAVWLIAPMASAAEPPPAQPLPGKMEMTSGPFQPTWESLAKYRCPEWFRDAKLGIWAVWGPKSAPQQGDWYARRMYEEGGEGYQHHVKTYGHASKFGFKDVIPLWKAERWDPDGLMQLYRKAGAKGHGYKSAATVLQMLARGSDPVQSKVTAVSLLGHAGELSWEQTQAGLVVTLPKAKPCRHAYVLKIIGQRLEPSPMEDETVIKPPWKVIGLKSVTLVRG